MLQLLDLDRGGKLVLAKGAAYYVASGDADFSTGVRNAPCPIGTLVLSPRQGQIAARRDSVIAVFEHTQLQGTDVPVLIRYGKPVHTISKMVYETTQGDPWSGTVVAGLELELVGYINRACAHSHFGADEDLFRSIVEYIEENIGGPLSLHSIAEGVGARPRAISATIQRVAGRSFRNYVMRKRLDVACRRIVHSDASLGEIAIDAGFADQAHFTREFKRIIGVPPSQYHPERHDSLFKQSVLFKTGV